MTNGFIADNSNNPRIQCTNCGRWTRLNNAEGKQLIYPAFDYTKKAGDENWEIDGQHCLRCIEKLTPQTSEQSTIHPEKGE